MTDTDRIQINEARIRAEFDELARIDSESFGEREMADRLKEKLAELGIQAKEDDTAEKIGGNAGNLFGTADCLARRSCCPGIWTRSRRESERSRFFMRTEPSLRMEPPCLARTI